MFGIPVVSMDPYLEHTIVPVLPTPIEIPPDYKPYLRRFLGDTGIVPLSLPTITLSEPVVIGLDKLYLRRVLGDSIL